MTHEQNLSSDILNVPQQYHTDTKYIATHKMSQEDAKFLDSTPNNIRQRVSRFISVIIISALPVIRPCKIQPITGVYIPTLSSHHYITFCKFTCKLHAFKHSCATCLLCAVLYFLSEQKLYFFNVSRFGSCD